MMFSLLLLLPYIYYRFVCCHHCSSCVLSLMLMYVSDSSSVSCRYFRTTLSNSVKAGHLYLASLATLQMVKGRSAEGSVIQCFTKSCSLIICYVTLQSFVWLLITEVSCLKVSWFDYVLWVTATTLFCVRHIAQDVLMMQYVCVLCQWEGQILTYTKPLNQWSLVYYCHPWPSVL